jgi:hypothetical protein
MMIGSSIVGRHGIVGISIVGHMQSPHPPQSQLPQSQLPQSQPPPSQALAADIATPIIATQSNASTTFFKMLILITLHFIPFMSFFLICLMTIIYHPKRYIYQMAYKKQFY